MDFILHTWNGDMETEIIANKPVIHFNARVKSSVYKYNLPAKEGEITGRIYFWVYFIKI